MSEFYSPELARGVRWDDPTFQIVWPEKIEVISEWDRNSPISDLDHAALKQSRREGPHGNRPGVASVRS
jgi:hypothetical protein